MTRIIVISLTLTYRLMLLWTCGHRYWNDVHLELQRLKMLTDPMAEKTIIIIGAGIAGLAAGCYAQMNGYRSRIFELHDLPGGLCTAWERKGYVFDGCIHYLYGSGQGQPFNRMWQELGAVQGRHMVNHDELMRVVGPDGRTFIAFCDPDRLADHMKAQSPADARLIDILAGGVRAFTRFDMSALQEKPKRLMKPGDWLAFGQKMLPFLGPLARWGPISARDFAGRFRDPFLRRALPLVFGWQDIPMMAALSILASMHKGNAGFPAGGSLEFARGIERRYLDLGGEIRYKSQVQKILVELVAGGGSKAVGVRLYNDEEHFADHVISAADGYGTIFDLLDGRFINRQSEHLYSGHMPIHSIVQVSLGVDRDMSAEPHWATYLLDPPVLIADALRGELGVKHYCFDPCQAPAGKSSVEVMLESRHGYWQRIYGRKLYDTEQLQVADLVIDQLDRIYPGLRAQIEVVDVATPLSYERYTGNWLGSSCGWLLTKKTMAMMIKGVDKRLPGLDNFFMAGQWVEPGGTVTLAAASGRNAMQLVCSADRRPFVTAI